MGKEHVRERPGHVHHAALGDHLFSLKVFAMGWTEILMLTAL